MNTYKGLKVPESAKPSDIGTLLLNDHAINRMDAHCEKWYKTSFCESIDCEECIFDEGAPDEEGNFKDIRTFEQWEKENETNS